MPTLISNQKKQQNISQLKKFYSILIQGIDISKAKHGDIENWDWNLDQTNFIETYLIENLKIAKNCKTKAGCWNSSGKIFAYSKKNTQFASDITSYYKLELADGTYLAIFKENTEHCHFYIDLNGARKPNRYGEDCYILTFTKSKFNDYIHDIPHSGLYFYGFGLPRTKLINDPYGYGCNKNGIGELCGALYQADGWQNITGN